MVSREEESAYKKQLRNSLSLKGLRSNFNENIGPEPNYRRFLVRPSRDIHGWPTPRVMIDHNGSANASRLCRKFAIPVKSDDIAYWVGVQNDYINDLSDRDSDILTSYTQVGDRLINNFLRGTLGDLEDMLTTKLELIFVIGYFLYDQYEEYATKMDLSMVSKEKLLTSRGHVDVVALNTIVERNMKFMRNPSNITSLLQQYKEELERIIWNAPRLPNRLTVYRGFQDEGHLRGLEFVNPDFFSTSVSLQSAIYFSAMQYWGYPKRHHGLRYLGGVYEITLDPTIPCIYMESITQCENEFEVLLPPGLYFTSDSKIHYKIKPDKRTPNIFALMDYDQRVGIVHVTVNAGLHILADEGSSVVFTDKGANVNSSAFITTIANSPNTKNAKNTKNVKEGGYRKTKKRSRK